MPKSGIIDGDNLKGLIFPTEGWNFDVFISHSHNNVVQAKKFAAYLSRENIELRSLMISSGEALITY